MSDKNLPGELYDQLEPGSQSISPNHFTANTTASDNSAASQRQRILDPAKPESRVRHVPLATILKRAIVHAGVRGDITPKAAQKLLAALNLQEA